MLNEENYKNKSSSKSSISLKKDGNKYIYIFVTVVIILMVLVGCAASKKSLPLDAGTQNKMLEGKQKVNVSIQTDKGEMIAELRPDLMPITVNNFVKLINMKFYDGLKFHRVEDMVIQGGDPKGNGTGGPGWAIKLETSSELKNIKYCIAMARSKSPDSAGSQFYILKRDVPQLDGEYAVFGNIIKGQEVVDKIVIGDSMKSIKLISN